MTAYYNEIEPYKAQWLRNLIDAGLIAPGDVDERSITEVTPGDIKGYTQCHFFAGIGLWSHALRLAGWPDDEPIWTASCPCQPFSTAGSQAGVEDERHLWPDLFRLVKKRRPERIIGEQVSNGGGLAWFDIVCADLQATGYAAGAVDTCSAGVGAPNIRQRLYWVCDANGEGLQGHAGHGDNRERWPHPTGSAATAGLPGWLADANGGQCHRQPERGRDDDHRQDAGRPQAGCEPESCGQGSRVADANSHEQREGRNDRGEGIEGAERLHDAGGYYPQFAASTNNPFWRATDWLFCRDGCWRPVEPSAFCLAPGYPGRVDHLRAIGDAINPQVAKVAVLAYMDYLA